MRTFLTILRVVDQMTVTEANKILKFADVSTLLKESTVIWVDDTEAHKTYKTNLKMLAKAIAMQLVKDGVIPGVDEA